MTKINSQQECIPVECIPPAAAAIGERGSASVHAGIPPLGVGLPQCMLGCTHLIWVWAWRPPGCGPADPWVCAWSPSWVWAWRPPWVWTWRPPGHTPQLPSWVWAWRPPWPDTFPTMNRKTDRQV